MSICGGYCSTNQKGKPTFNITVSDFLKDVCTKSEGDVEKTVDNFIEMMIQLLFKFVELLPLYRVQLNRIIRILVEFGVQYRYNLSSNKDSSKSVSTGRKTSSVDPKTAYSELYDLDKKIIELQDVKMQIYNELFKKDFTDVNIKMEVVDQSFKGDLSSKESVEVFNPGSVKKLAQLIQIKGKEKSFDSSVPLNYMITDNTNHEGHKVPSEQAEKKTCKNVTKVSEIKDNCVSKLDTINVSSPAMCMRVYGDLCMVGCENGQLQIFSLESGELMDIIQAHSMVITSLVIWNDIMVTSSLDESLRSFNLKKNSTKRITIEHPIETTDDSDGVLYAGTSNGKIIRFNMLSLTQIGMMFHVSSSKIICMKVFRNGSELLLVVSAEKKPIAIRSAETGTLLKTLQVNNIRSFEICEQNKLWFGISEDSLYTMYLNKSEGVEHMLNGILSKISLFGDLIVVYGNDGSIYLFDQELVLQNTLSVEMKGDITAVAIWKNYVVMSYRHMGLLKMTDLDQKKKKRKKNKTSKRN